jgi:hypothetical protein
MLDVHGILERDWNIGAWRETPIAKVVALTKGTSTVPNCFFPDRTL